MDTSKELPIVDELEDVVDKIVETVDWVEETSEVVDSFVELVTVEILDDIEELIDVDE